MALRFEAAGDRLEIHQTRKGARIAMWLVLAFGALGAALTFRTPSTHIAVDCGHGHARCTLTYAHKTVELPVSELGGVQLGDDSLDLARTGKAPYHLCSGPRAELADKATLLTGFLAKEASPPIAFECEYATSAGVPLPGKIAGIAGVLVIIALFGMFLVEAHTVIDRAAGTIEMRGRSWPFKRWNVSRKLADVTNIATRRVYVGRGQHMYLIDVVFADGPPVRAFSPAAYKPATLDEQIATLKRFVG